MATEIELAWAGGLFEGEGCITMSGPSRCPRLKLNMTDFDTVEKFYKIVGTGNIGNEKVRNEKHLPQRSWYASSKADVIAVLDMLMPYLGERRKRRAAEVLCRAMNSPENGWDESREDW